MVRAKTRELQGGFTSVKLLGFLVVVALAANAYLLVRFYQQPTGSQTSLARGIVTNDNLSPALKNQLTAAVAVAGALPVATSAGIPNSCSTGQVLSFSNGKIVCVTLQTTSSGAVSVTVVGPPGPKGDSGTNGSSGSNGASGTNGVDGVAGSNGSTGSTGAQGIQGIQGLKGDNGNVGATGAVGATGSTGANGVAGSAGVLNTTFGNGLSGSLAAQTLSLNLVTDPNGGLSTGSNGLRLLANCSTGQILKWSGSAWTCNVDNIGSIGSADLTSNTSGVTINGGTGAVLGNGTTISIATATASQTGLLGAVDWNTFNTKQAALTFSGNGLFSQAGTTITGTTCTASQVLKYSGSSWVCGSDNNTTYTAGAGVALSGTTLSFDPSTLSTVNSVAGTDQVLVYDGSSTKRITYNDLFGGVLGSLNYRGAWNANTNSPSLTSVCTAGTKGYYYVVSDTGTTSLSGINNWNINDWAICNGTSWQRIQTTNAVSSVFGRQGLVVAQTGDYTASQITNTPAGGITSSNAQSALNELDTKKLTTTLNSGLLFVGNSTNVATGVALSGDATLSNSGVLTLANSSVTSAKIADGSITFADFASNSCSDGQVIKYSTSSSAWTCGSSGTTYTAASTGANQNTPIMVSASTIGFSSGSATGQYWAWDGTKWALVTPSAGLSVGAVDSQTATSAGATIANNILYMQSASASNPGLVNTGAQTIAGNKTLTGVTTHSGLTYLNANTYFTGLLVGTGTASFDSSSATGTFSTSSGVNTLNGNVNISAGKSVTLASGSGTFDASASSGAFKTSTGLTTVSGSALLATPATIANISTGGAIGSAATTVDSYAAFNINQTTTGQTLTLPVPTVTTAGRIAYINNIGSASFTMLGTLVAAGSGIIAQYSGSAWSLTGASAAQVALSIGAVDGQTKSSSGATVASNTLYLQSADATNPGLITTGTQTIAGNKTLTGLTTLSGNLQQSSSETTGAALAIVANNLTSGNGLSVSSNATTTGGTLVNFNASGASAAGNTLQLSNAGSGLALLISSGGLAVASSGTYTNTGTQNDANFGNYSNVRLNPGSALTLSGITGGTNGRLLFLTNASSNVVTLSNAGSGSVAANRIQTMNGRDLSLSSNGTALLLYDSSSSLWRVISAQTDVTTRDYAFVRFTGTDTNAIADGTVISFDASASGNLPYASSKYFTLTAGKTYEIESQLQLYYNGNPADGEYCIYNYTSGGCLNNAYGYSATPSESTHIASGAVAKTVFTATSSIQVGVALMAHTSGGNSPGVVGNGSSSTAAATSNSQYPLGKAGSYFQVTQL